ncbi:MAG: MFS transporter [Anaerolineales bacterium]
MTHEPTAPHVDPAWRRTLYIVFTAQVMTAVGFSSVFPFLPLYVSDLGSTSGLSVELLSGLVFSAQAFTMMIASPIWGALADRWGRKLMVERAMFGGAVLLLLMAFVRSAEELVLLRALQGMVTGTVSAANALVASAAPRGRTGFAMGMLQVGLGAGVALGPLIGGAVADAYGYSAAFFVTAALLLLAGLLVLFGVNEQFDPAQGEELEPLAFRRKWMDILSLPGVRITYLLEFLSYLGRMMLIPVLPLFIADLLQADIGLNTFTGMVIGAGSVATTLTAVYFGGLGDRIGYRKVLVAAAVATGVVYAMHAWAQNGWQLLVMTAIAGVGLGGVRPSIGALLAAHSHRGDEGAVYGLDNSVRAAGRALAPLIGSLIAVEFGIRAAFPIAGAVMLLTAWTAWARLPRAELAGQVAD